MKKKRKPDSMSSVEGSGKRPKVVDSIGKGQQGRGRFCKCGRLHEGTCMVSGSGCFKCGRTGHISRDCTATTTITPISDLIYFQCNKRGHKKTHCLSLAAVGP